MLCVCVEGESCMSLYDDFYPPELEMQHQPLFVLDKHSTTQLHAQDCKVDFLFTSEDSLYPNSYKNVFSPFVYNFEDLIRSFM